MPGIEKCSVGLIDVMSAPFVLGDKWDLPIAVLNERGQRRQSNGIAVGALDYEDAPFVLPIHVFSQNSGVYEGTAEENVNRLVAAMFSERRIHAASDASATALTAQVKSFDIEVVRHEDDTSTVVFSGTRKPFWRGSPTAINVQVPEYAGVELESVPGDVESELIELTAVEDDPGAPRPWALGVHFGPYLAQYSGTSSVVVGHEDALSMSGMCLHYANATAASAGRKTLTNYQGGATVGPVGEITWPTVVPARGHYGIVPVPPDSNYPLLESEYFARTATALTYTKSVLIPLDWFAFCVADGAIGATYRDGRLYDLSRFAGDTVNQEQESSEQVYGSRHGFAPGDNSIYASAACTVTGSHVPRFLDFGRV